MSKRRKKSVGGFIRDIAALDRLERAKKIAEKEGITLREAYRVAWRMENPPPKPGDLIQQGNAIYEIQRDGSRRRVAPKPSGSVDPQ